jgi:tetratricopeptide (TPR) repeat protein
MVSLMEPKPVPKDVPKFLPKASREAATALNEGNRLLGEHKYVEALKAYDRAIAINPDVAEAHYNRGIALFASGKPLKRNLTDAMSSFERAISLGSDFAEAHNMKGFMLLCLSEDNLQEALGSFERALELDPGLYSACINRAIVLLDLGRLDEAYEATKHAAALEPSEAESALLRQLILDEFLRRLSKRRVISWGGGKPKGSIPPIPITAGPPISDYVVEDRG